VEPSSGSNVIPRRARPDKAGLGPHRSETLHPKRVSGVGPVELGECRRKELVLLESRPVDFIVYCPGFQGEGPHMTKDCVVSASLNRTLRGTLYHLPWSRPVSVCVGSLIW
jgi:hypothetical protein